jgi:ryanodine receptor 2
MMTKQDYIPQPIDTSEVRLPEELEALAERMARNVHEVWARQRMAQGWTYGPKLDDEKKTHPCLVSYDELPEEEKDYDRNTSMGTLKLLMKWGYKIGK